jgi:hypothetical protein
LTIRKINERISQNATDAIDVATSKSKFTRDERLLRQLKKIGESHQRQIAYGNQKVFEFNSNEFHIQLDSKTDFFNWSYINNLIGIAKQEGYASITVDGCFVYTAIYKNEPIVDLWSESLDLPFQNRIQEDVVKSSIWFQDKTKNILHFAISMSYSLDLPPYPNICPYLVAPLEKEYRLDLLNRRLIVIVVMNLGKVVEKLISLGINASIPQDENEFRKFFIPAQKVNEKYGFTIDLANCTQRFSPKLYHEFLSLNGFASFILQIVDFMEQKAIEKITSTEDKN